MRHGNRGGMQFAAVGDQGAGAAAATMQVSLPRCPHVRKLQFLPMSPQCHTRPASVVSTMPVTALVSVVVHALQPTLHLCWVRVAIYYVYLHLNNDSGMPSVHSTAWPTSAACTEAFSGPRQRRGSSSASTLPSTRQQSASCGGAPPCTKVSCQQELSLPARLPLHVFPIGSAVEASMMACGTMGSIKVLTDVHSFFAEQLL